ncbi:MAG: Maf family nucleotide pyrophosphatase [Flavobacterium sp.]
MKSKRYKIILGSASPRRHQFFKEMGLDFEVRLQEVEEIYPYDLKGVEITDFLAQLKAGAYQNLAENELVITSDTIVWHENKALGKPKNELDAKAMLASMSEKTHEVITSVCFKTNQFCNVINETTLVTFKKLTSEMIDFYVEKFKPLDKAGAYGIQEWIGLVGVEKIEGSYSNVVGLPTSQVYAFLRQLEG